MIEVLDHGFVKFIEAWGSDERIIEAARQSTGKDFQGWDDATYSCSCHYPDGCEKCKGKGSYTVKGDQHLLSYLYNHKHMTPFEMAGMTIQVQAPIMVFREWHRHRTQSYNEMSGRYIELPSLGYIPSVERIMAGRQSSSNKQGSEEGFSYEEAAYLRNYYVEEFERARNMYDRLLKNNVARELARLVLPVNQYSRMMASANLRNWLAFLLLRDDPAAQWEIQQYAQIVASIVAERFPRTYELFIKGKNG